MPDKNFVESLRKGLEVLTCFDRRHTRLTLTEVSRRIDVTPASARRSLATLVELGYLGSDGKLYWMLPKALLVAYSYLSSRPMPALAQPLLDALSEKTRESASLGTLLDEDAWDSPGRLTDADLFAHAGSGWRRADALLDDPEDDR